jgi:hypothetical protein
MSVENNEPKSPTAQISVCLLMSILLHAPTALW